MDDIYKNIEEYNSNKKRKTLIVFNEMIADTLNVIVTDFFIRGRAFNISLLFSFNLMLLYLKMLHLLLCTIRTIKKSVIFNKLLLIIYHLSLITFQDFMNLYKKCTAKSYCFFVVVDDDDDDDDDDLFLWYG